MSFTEHAIEVLRERGYKVTKPRKQVREAIEKAEGPMSPYDIGKMMEKERKHLDQVTIYRVVNLLSSLNLVHKVFLRGGYVRCDLLEEEGCHRFLLCRGCGNLQEFRDEALCDQESQIAQKMGFQAEHHVTESSGLCKDCRD
jgi:Fur family ferric uptake transcriptional regulator